jgi:23S rRNA (guanosine2251-2'-O)-methyltransferase
VAKKPSSKRPGTGGHGRKALEGKGPTPKAEDRHWYKDKRRQGRPTSVSTSKAPRKPQQDTSQESHVVSGRNPVVEALRAKIPVSQITLQQRIERDQRINEIMQLAHKRSIPVIEATKPELDRLAGHDIVHQGVVLSVPPYRYHDPLDLAEKALDRGNALLVATDGVTDPRNLGAIIRSAAAFGGQGVIVPKRRSVGVTPAVWKTSAGQLSHAPVAMATNLTNTLKALKERGYFVVGLAGDTNDSLPEVALGDVPVVVVVGAEGAGLSRLVRETCDMVVSIPIDPKTESLNASVAAGIALYEIARQRAR